DEDTSRLVLADWLEDQRRPIDRLRGEFVRAQVTLHRAQEEDRHVRAAHEHDRLVPYWGWGAQNAQADPFPRRPALAALAARADELAAEYGPRWAGLLGTGSRHTRWRRGLLAMGCPPRDFPSREMEAVARSEVGRWLYRIGFSQTYPRDYPRISRCPLLGQASE